MLSALQRDGEIGGVSERKLLPDMSSAIFQQDGAPAHTAKKTQDWLKTNIPNFWPKGIWPPNSPDLSPIENLWSIMKDTISSYEGATNLRMLENQLISAWRGLSPEFLDKLICSMPGRIQEGNWNIQISEVYRISNNICENFWNLDIPRGINLLKY